MRLKPFKPDKELKKSNRKYSKKQLISTLLVLAVLITIGTSHAIFSIQPEYYTFIKSQVGEFSTSDIKLFVTVEGEKLDEFPAKDSGYVYEKVTCENGGTGTWDADNWQIKLSVSGPDECTINFVKYVIPASEYVESLLASNPETMNNDDPDGNVRYMGANPNNYVSFNNELWRIIGVFTMETTSGQIEKRVKLIRSESIGEFSWDTSSSTVNGGFGVNEWSQSDLMTLLNYGAYWNRTSGTCYNNYNDASLNCNFTNTGLTETAKNMLDDATWNYGTINGISIKLDNAISTDYYNAERSTNSGKICSNNLYCNDSISRTTQWVGKVGLMTVSDYSYATNGGNTTNRSTCLNLPISQWNDSSYNYCIANNWIYIAGLNQWTIIPAPATNEARYSYATIWSGELYSSYSCVARAVRPVVYLKSNVKIIDGDGSSSNPYQLALTNN